MSSLSPSPKREQFEEATVLITGGAGAIGSNLTERLINLGAEIIIIDDLSSGYEWLIPESEQITFIEGDILDEEKLKRAFKHDLDYVYHLAAHFANKNSVDHPETDLEVNGMGTLKILEYAQMQNLDRFVYASSGCGVYGHDSELPFDESDVSMDLDTPYQVTKMLGELYTNYFNNLYNLPIANARFFNSFGPGEVPGKYRNVIPNFFYWAYQGRDLPITGDGSETRDWTYVGDIVNGLLKMGVVDGAVGESFNLATGHDTQVIDMAKKILSRVDSNSEIKYIGRRDWDNKARIVGSIQKSSSALGYEPQTTFDEGLDEVHAWFDKNMNQINSCAEF
jgi:nucleoside-diphosphate-sugar epimerase